jgi:hypothetical protein
MFDLGKDSEMLIGTDEIQAICSKKFVKHPSAFKKTKDYFKAQAAVYQEEIEFGWKNLRTQLHSFCI